MIRLNKSTNHFE